MKRTDYTLDELSRPDPYHEDQELATLARHLATTRFQELGAGRCGRGDLKTEFLAGQHADIVHAEGQALAKKAEAQDKALSDLREADLPDGYSIEITLDEILVRGPFDKNLHPRIKRAGGYWDGQAERNRKLWSIPRDRAPSLKRVLGNWSEGAAERELERREQQIAFERREAERWLGYVEEKAPDGYWYKKGEQKLAALQVARWPDLQARLEAAAATYREGLATKQRADAERWLGYVEEKAATGYRYRNGIAKLRELRIDRWPDLAQRLEVALGACAEAERSKQAAQDARRSEREGERARQRKPRLLFPLTHLPPENRPIRRGSTVVVFEGVGKTFRIGDDMADIHGLLGHEGELGCYAYYRPATADESAALERQETAQAAHREATRQRREAIEQIQQDIQSRGDRPEGSNVPEGERLIDSQNIYGGGEWFVVGREWIWFCLNNGHDGDDWSYNNVRTGGAGAIGWRIPFDQTIAGRLQTLQDECRELSNG